METPVFFTVDNKLAGIIAVADKIKKSSFSAVERLLKSGVNIAMITGDNLVTATNVAGQLGITSVIAGVMPEDKAKEVDVLQKSGITAMAGDGINDAPVLSRADIGIAMGALGSDAAIEAADIVLMDDDPSKIALARKISVHTLKIVKENIWFALIVKAVCLVLGALGIANMWIAIFADVGVMVIAVLNAIRALKLK